MQRTQSGCKNFTKGTVSIDHLKCKCNALVKGIVDVRVAYMRKLAILSNREPMVTAHYNPVLCSYLWHVTLIPDKVPIYSI